MYERNMTIVIPDLYDNHIDISLEAGEFCRSGELNYHDKPVRRNKYSSRELLSSQ